VCVVCRVVSCDRPVRPKPQSWRLVWQPPTIPRSLPTRTAHLVPSPLYSTDAGQSTKQKLMMMICFFFVFLGVAVGGEYREAQVPSRAGRAARVLHDVGVPRAHGRPSAMLRTASTTSLRRRRQRTFPLLLLKNPLAHTNTNITTTDRSLIPLLARAEGEQRGRRGGRPSGVPGGEEAGEHVHAGGRPSLLRAPGHPPLPPRHQGAVKKKILDISPISF
jgi:hypothetical protein